MTEVPLSQPLRWQKPLVLFLLTVASVFFAGGARWDLLFDQTTAASDVWTTAGLAAQFAVPLMAILLAHEFGHYIAARLHGIPASLPYFLPLPILSPFGTMGAVILVSEQVRKRDALLDFGAAGPLAGLILAIPLMIYGLTLSEVQPLPPGGWIQEGQSILYWALKYAVFGPIPDGSDVHLHPVAFAAWAGFLVTFFNLLPFSQLDGGHIAYALLGERQNRLAKYFFFVPLVILAYNAVRFGVPVFLGIPLSFGDQGLSTMTFFGATLPWVVLFVLLFIIRSTAGANHPSTDTKPTLGPVRKGIAIFTLSFYVLLFMPTPLLERQYEPTNEGASASGASDAPTTSSGASAADQPTTEP